MLRVRIPSRMLCGDEKNLSWGHFSSLVSEHHAKDPIATAGIHAKRSINRVKPTHKHSVRFSGLPPEAGQLIFTNNLLLELE